MKKQRIMIYMSNIWAKPEKRHIVKIQKRWNNLRPRKKSRYYFGKSNSSIVHFIWQYFLSSMGLFFHHQSLPYFYVLKQKIEHMKYEKLSVFVFLLKHGRERSRESEIIIHKPVVWDLIICITLWKVHNHIPKWMDISYTTFRSWVAICRSKHKFLCTG